MEKTELLKKVEELAPWHHRLDLGQGVFTAPERMVRSELRSKMIFPLLSDLCGGSLEGHRVIDVACNCGFFSFEAQKYGAQYVIGIDGREKPLKQAEFARDVLNLSKVEFLQSDVYKLCTKTVGRFDICLCLGILYHLDKPIYLLEKLSEITQKYFVIDTQVCKDPENRSMMLLKQEGTQEYLEIKKKFLRKKGYDVGELSDEFVEYQTMVNALYSGVVFIPTAKALVNMLMHVGFKNIIKIIPTSFLSEQDRIRGTKADNETITPDKYGKESHIWDYINEQRVTFIAKKA